MSERKVVKHPATVKREREESAAFSDVWTRWMKMQRQANVVRDMAWTGMMAINFTFDEFQRVAHLLSPHEVGLASKIWPQATSEAFKDFYGDDK